MDSPDERLEWLRPSALLGSELLVVGNSMRAWHVYHDRYAVCACRTAAAAWRYRGQSLFFHDRSFGLLEPGETHSNTFIHKPMDFHVLLVSPEVFLRAAEEQGLSGEVHFRLAQSVDPRLYNAIQNLAASVETAESPLEQQSWLVLCIHRMQAFAERAVSNPSEMRMGAAVKRAADCLRERYRESVDLEELSALTGLSRFCLVHAFSRRMGIPPPFLSDSCPHRTGPRAAGIGCPARHGGCRCRVRGSEPFQSALQKDHAGHSGTIRKIEALNRGRPH